MTYSLDFRKKVLKMRAEKGLSIEEVAIRFGVGKASVMRWLIDIEPKKKRNRPYIKTSALRGHLDPFFIQESLLFYYYKPVGHHLRIV